MLKRLKYWLEHHVWYWFRTGLYGFIAIYTGIALLGYAVQKGVINF